MMRWHDGWSPGTWIAVLFVMLVFWTVVVAAAVALVRGNPLHHAPGGPPHPPAPDDARRILDERFARGELDADEYTRRRDLLRRG